MENFPDPILACPHCKSGTLFSSEQLYSCAACKRTYRITKAYPDFTGIVDNKPGISQRLMESDAVSLLYEKFWRPAITFPFSDYRWEKKMIMDFMELKGPHYLLDIACGTGNFTRLFADALHHNNSQIIGMDISTSMLYRATRTLSGKQAYSNVHFIRADVNNLPFAPASFDRIHCSGALHLFPFIQNVFSSVSKALKPGGIFAGSTYIKKSDTGKAVKNALEPWLKFHWFEMEELQKLALQAGLTGWEHCLNKQGIIFRLVKK